ncbi:deaminase domain-containing protein [Pseudoteredinibacter isoporae]|uniref:deaminase domain-containing protein n=1 Tax=Pseudoteredinibacter isoporae TaxID=570281 RepID=UPI003103C26D
MNARIDLGFNSNRKRAQNFTIADYDIDGVQGRLFALSGKNSPSSTVGIPDARQFETTFINGTDRAWDTEVKILETLGPQFNSSSSGTIRLLSELEVCGSCSGVIQQFEKAYPGVKVQPETGPYPKKQRFSK